MNTNLTATDTPDTPDRVTDLAPFPKTRHDATADAMARHLAVVAHANITRMSHSAECVTYQDAAQRVTDLFGVTWLLRNLRSRDPEAADQAARGLWAQWEDGGAVAETLWEWLRGYGIDPEQVTRIAQANLGADARPVSAMTPQQGQILAKGIDRLETLTQAATRGPWSVETISPGNLGIYSTRAHAYVADVGDEGIPETEADGAYIAAMDPEVGAAIIDLLKVVPTGQDVTAAACHLARVVSGDHHGSHLAVAPDGPPAAIGGE